MARPKLPARPSESALGGEEAFGAKGLPQPHGGVDGGLLAQTGQQRDELVAAVAEAGVLRPQHALHQAANLGEQAAADQVAVGVVDLLEVVEVDEQQAELVVAIGRRRWRPAHPAWCRGGAR